MCANPLRGIPSLHEILDNPKVKSLTDRLQPGAVVSTVRKVLDEVASEVQNAATEKTLPSVSELAERISRRVMENPPPSTTSAINATGIVLHPELGSPRWADAAVEAMVAAASGYVLRRPSPSGRVPDEADPARERIRELTGAEDALVFSSAAAAMVAVLPAISGRMGVVVARRDLIRRGPDYDLPALVDAGAFWTYEVGAANHVDLDDYRQSLAEEVGAVLTVLHGSGSKDEPCNDTMLDELADLVHDEQLPLICDLGPATLVDLAPLGVDGVPHVRQGLEAGADLVVLSHEMLGGPPCGIVAGRRGLIEKIERHAPAKAARASRPVLAALAATLQGMHSADEARTHVPLLELVCASADNLKQRADRMAPQMAAAAVIETAEIVPAAGSVTGEEQLAGWAIALHPCGISADDLAEALAQGEPAVVGSADGDRVLLNLRSVPGESDVRLVAAVEGVNRDPDGEEE